jgi:nitric oxide reductase NorD protein
MGSVSGLDLYRAMGAHMAAHITCSDKGLSQQSLNPAQIFFVGMLEDARVEYCATREFPGLRGLFKSLMPHSPAGHYEHDTMYLLEKTRGRCWSRVCRPAIRPSTRWSSSFISTSPPMSARPCSPGGSVIELYNLLAERRCIPSLRILESLNIPYRDDNRFVWSMDDYDWSESNAYRPELQRQVRRNVGLMEFINEVDVETAGDDAQEVWVLSTELFPYEDEGVSYNEMEGKEPVSDPFHYAEWDYKVQLHRPSWATVYERRQGKGDPEAIDNVLTAHKGVSHRIRQIVDRLRPQGISRQRRLEDGDELDINAAVDAIVMTRIGMQPDPRITMRNVINRRDLAVVILLDLSESTNEMVRGTEKTVLELTREASALVASAISGIGDPFAIHGFASDGRHDVQYYRFKDFEQRLDADVKSRLAGMKGGLSTRMGAAMRHAAHHLSQRSEQHKLLLIVTDGEPADIDERDPQYLRMDAKKATVELQQMGISSYCLTLDPEADRYVARIFGSNNYTIVDQVERLPEKLPSLFANLTK